MKLFAYLICTYFVFLTLLPSVKSVRMHFANKCKTECTKKVKNQIPLGCNKEKCILNLNFSFGQFLVSKLQYEFIINSFKLEKRMIFSFHEEIISNYNDTIWQPPEAFSRTV